MGDSTDAIKSRLDAAFAKSTKEQKVPGIAAVILDVSGKELYKGAFGGTDVNDPDAPPMTTSTPALIYSCTKLVTTVAALQLLEHGKFALDDLVEKYIPEIKNLEVLEGFNEDGSPILRPQKTQATILHLMTHTSGLSYDLFDHDTLRWRMWSKQAPVQYYLNGTRDPFYTPLSADAGSRHVYGISTDWLGFVVEQVSGLPIHEYFEKHIFQPLAMTKTTPYFVDGSDWLNVHLRNEDGTLTAEKAIAMPKELEMRGGGGYLVSTLDDYSQILLAILNDGMHPISKTRILKETTVKDYLFQDKIAAICSPDNVGEFDGPIPTLTNRATFLPGIRKGWSCGLMLNLDDNKKGRSAGSGAWAGLDNCYYWIDPAAQKLGLLFSSVLPFMDEAVIHLFDELERAAYGHGAAKVMGEEGCSYKIHSGIAYNPTQDPPDLSKLSLRDETKPTAT